MIVGRWWWVQVCHEFFRCEFLVVVVDLLWGLWVPMQWRFC